MNIKQLDKQTELDNCVFVKTILMLLVVLDHSAAFWTGDWFTKDPVFAAKALAVLSKWLSTVHTKGFILVSGYLFCYIKYEKMGYQAFRPFLANKARRLLVPYVFVAAIWVAPLQHLFVQLDGVSFIKNYLLGISPSQLWFLLMLFCVFVIFWPLSDFFRKHDGLGVVFVLGLYFCGIAGSMIMPNVFRIFTSLQSIPLFWLGFKLRQHGTQLVRRIPVALWILTSIAVFAFTWLLGNMSGMIFKVLNIGFSFVAQIVGAVMAFVVLQTLANKVKWKSKGFAFMSKRSMPVYLFHQQVIYFSVYWLNGIINPYLNAAVNFICAMGISLMIATLLMKFRTTRYLIGEG